MTKLRERVGLSIVGQERMIERLIVALLADGHVLIEGLPGLAKTRAVKSLSQCIEWRFSRIQFTPDLLPSDVTGGEIYRDTGSGGSFEFRPGPARQSRPWRRDQSGTGEGALGAARGDGRAAGHHRRHAPQPA